MKKILIVLFTLGIFVIVGSVSAGSTIYSSLKGKIILRVEENGEAYYVNPKKEEALYLGRPADAFNLFRGEGIGITNSNLDKIPVGLSRFMSGVDTDGDDLPDNLEIALATDGSMADTDGDGYSDYAEVASGNDPNGAGPMSFDPSFAKAQVGKIFLQVERNGEAWYVDTSDYKRYYLGTPEAAFDIMRSLGLGISETNFSSLPTAEVYTPIAETENGQMVLDKLWEPYKDITTYSAVTYAVDNPAADSIEYGQTETTQDLQLEDLIVDIGDVNVEQIKAEKAPGNYYYQSPDKNSTKFSGSSPIEVISNVYGKGYRIKKTEEKLYRGVPVAIIEYIDTETTDVLTGGNVLIRMWVEKTNTYRLLRFSAYSDITHPDSEWLKDSVELTDKEAVKLIDGRYLEILRDEYLYDTYEILPSVLSLSVGNFLGFLNVKYTAVMENYELGAVIPEGGFDN